MRTIELDFASGRATGTASGTRILVGCGGYDSLGSLMAATGLSGPFLVVSQKRVLDSVDPAPIRRYPVAVIADGERAKTLRTVRRVLDRMLDLQMTRQSTVIALGGGVVGDVAGFAASLFLRGVSVVQVPTTLLAQVDSSVGGKTGVNHRVGKNLIGTFHHPRLVVADPGLLETLPAREYRSGLYEVLKYGVIRDPVLFGMFEGQVDGAGGAIGRRDAAGGAVGRRDAAVLEDLVYRSLAIKASVVAADEKEGDLRRILNFGHTIGHAIETAAGYRKIRHGEAVGYGMIGAADIAMRLDMIGPAEAGRIAGAVGAIGRLPGISGLPVGEMMDSMRHDKKVRDGRLHFVLPESIGSVVVRSGISPSMVRSAIRRLTR